MSDKLWVAIYVDECGDIQGVYFNKFEDASNFLKICDNKLGVTATHFFQEYCNMYNQLLVESWEED